MTIEFVFFLAIVGILAAWVVLDGFDFGVGILLRFLGRNEQEREEVLDSIAPFWDGNEVLLVAAGGLLLAVFPTAFAVIFSGFYLPLMVFLWLIVFRALSLELRHQLRNPLWREAVDTAFSLSSLGLALIAGVALANLTRGVALDEDGHFFAPLWTDFTVRGRVGILDWYTLLVGVYTVVLLARHGALWACMRIEGPSGERARTAAEKLAWPVIAGAVVLAVGSYFGCRHLADKVEDAPAFAAILVIPPLAAWGSRRALLGLRKRWAFFLSAVTLVALIASAALALWPVILPSTLTERPGLSLLAASAGKSALRTAWKRWLPGAGAAALWFVIVYAALARKTIRQKSLKVEGSDA